MSVSKIRGFWAGAAGGAAAIAVLFAYRHATGMPTLAEALAERMIRLLPYQIFALILARLQHLAKPLGLVMSIVSLLVGFGLGGVLYAGVASRLRWRILQWTVVIAAVAWAVLTFGVLPLIEGGILGTPLTTIVTDPALPMALASVAYALVLASLLRAPSRSSVPGSAGLGPSGRATATVSRRARALSTGAGGGTDRALHYRLARRHLLGRSALVVAGAAVGTRLAGWSVSAARQVAWAAAEAFRMIKGMPPEVTPNGSFYQVSKNFFDPTVDVGKWRLEVTGLVNTPLKLSLDELKAVAAPVERYQTFECISNEVGGDLIGTAKWKAVRVRDVLARAGVQSGATTIVWHAADGYTESIARSIAEDPETLLAYEMNGVPIPQKHGAPVRVLLLNRYGMKQPKWLTGIEAVNHDYSGYWEQQGWSKEAIVKVNSAFTVEQREGGMLALGGWAYAGNRGISKVEFSPDDGKTWLPAAVKEPLNMNCWQFWSAEWKPPAPGEYTLKVRAYDGTGKMQPAQPKPTLPDGGQGYHTVKVKA
ncbi:MAG TPA: molybdopterin-dependent oxidoreductase [bacterium]|nr:molybdopterin-dependent oxidoreductase [bacterium]